MGGRSGGKALPSMLLRGLSPKQQRFVAEFLVDLNATQAAIRAGYSAKTAQPASSRLLSKVMVRRAVQAGAVQQLNKADISAERVVLELGRIGIADIRDLFDAKGHLKRPTELSDDAAAAVSSIEVVTRNIGDGEIEHVHKVRTWDKLKALELLAKRLGLLKDRVEHSGPDGGPIPVSLTALTTAELAARAEALAKRLKRGAR